MDHTEETHTEFYETTQNTYQAAKVAKLLNFFGRGKGIEYKNTSMDGIDIDPNNEIAESGHFEDNVDGEQLVANTNDDVTDGNDNTPSILLHCNFLNKSALTIVMVHLTFP